MRYISTFSGIEAASVAWEPLGWKPVCFCEVDEFPSAVLAHRYPSVPNLGDITKVDWGDVVARYGAADVVVGGSPCQSFSIAGGRESLGGESRLMFEFVRACADVRPEWVVWENVPGALSVRDGAFGQLLRELFDIGYRDLAWRVLDAQFFGVAQRRRRLFLVGHLGEGGASAAVLFEPDSVHGHPASGRAKREELARAARLGASCGGFKLHQGSGARGLGFEEEQSPTLTADWHNPAVITECLTPWDVESKRIQPECGVAPTLPSGTKEGMNIKPCVLAFNDGQVTSPQNGNKPQFGDACHTLAARDHVPTICISTANTNANGSNVSTDDVAYTLDGMNANAVCMSDTQGGASADEEMSGALTCHAAKDAPVICVQNTTCNAGIDEDLSGALLARGGAHG